MSNSLTFIILYGNAGKVTRHSSLNTLHTIYKLSDMTAMTISTTRWERNNLKCKRGRLRRVASVCYRLFALITLEPMQRDSQVICTIVQIYVRVGLRVQVRVPRRAARPEGAAQARGAAGPSGWTRRGSSTPAAAAAQRTLSVPAEGISRDNADTVP